MKIPLSWLKEYVDISMPVQELAHRLTMAGTEIGGVDTIGGWKNCYVGNVLSVEPHPNADRLSLCTVDIAGEQLRVVCGAPNVARGQKVPFARVGARLFNTHSSRHEILKAARIRGVESKGMICSELELGLGQDHTGIIVLPQDAPVGTPLNDYLGDQVLDADVTPNRPDCLSILGIAHEVAALNGSVVREPDVYYAEGGDAIEALTSVQVADPDLCYRYTASLVTGIEVGPSPDWLQNRLKRVGLRPINNVVDATNYVMLEFNQPLHAFDFDTLNENRIVVRQARPGEVLVSLDGVERKLAPPMLVISDARNAVGLAGVMGGANTEISNSTTSVLLESATFDPGNNRRTSQALRLRTEASIRFEKGLRPELAPLALRRATQLILNTAGGTAARGIIDVYLGDGPGLTILTLTPARLEKVMGVQFPQEQVQMTLESLGFECQPGAAGELRVTVPYWRSDIELEDDLVEEVARIIGYEDVPTVMLSTPIPHHQPQPLPQLRDEVKNTLVSLGLQEVITYPVIDLESLKKASHQEEIPDPLRLANPLNARNQYLRTTLRPGLLATIAANQAQHQGPLEIFETGRVYLPRQNDLPEEREMAAGVLVGPISQPSWLSATEDRLGLFDGKGLVASVLQRIGVVADYQESDDPVFAPGRGAAIVAGGKQVGLVGELHSTVSAGFEIDGSPIVMFELDVSLLAEARDTASRRYTPVSRFPVAVRDLSVIVDSQVAASRVTQAIYEHPLVSHASLFDVYSGGNIAPATRSLAFRIEFQARDHTLTAEEANNALATVLLTLEQEMGATLRGQMGYSSPNS